MTWFSILTLAAGASMDCVIIGFNYGVKGVRIGNGSNLFMAAVCFLGTFLSMLLGRLAGRFLDPAWGGVAGGLLFTCLGLWMLRGALFPRPQAARRRYSENPEIVDRDASHVIELRESLLIGLLLCVNNIGIGIGGGIAGIPILAAPAACAVFSFLFTKAGCLLGDRVESRRISRALEVASALLILLLGGGELVPAVLRVYSLLA